MSPSVDPLMPPTSRFPLSCGHGRVQPAAPDGPGGIAQPFGMSRAVRPVQAGEHEKKPTQKSRNKQTAITDDGRISGYTSDVEYYVEMDEE